MSANSQRIVPVFFLPARGLAVVSVSCVDSDGFVARCTGTKGSKRVPLPKIPVLPKMRPLIAWPCWSRELSTRKHSSIPWGAAGMAVLVIAVEAVVGSHWFELTDPVSLSWRFSAQAAETGVRDCEVLCLGDSLVKHGLVPSVIERTSGQRAANLSAARASTLLTYCLLRRTLELRCATEGVDRECQARCAAGRP